MSSRASMVTAGGGPADGSAVNGVAPSASPNTNSSRTPVPSSASRALSTNCGIVTRNRAPASRSWRLSSPGVYSGLIVVTVPPAMAVPKKATAYSGRLGL